MALGLRVAGWFVLLVEFVGFGLPFGGFCLLFGAVVFLVRRLVVGWLGLVICLIAFYVDLGGLFWVMRFRCAGFGIWFCCL